MKRIKKPTATAMTRPSQSPSTSLPLTPLPIDAVPSTTFSPTLPPETLISLILTTLLSSFAYLYWSNTIVPQKRVELSKSKRSGEIKGYLEDLRSDDEDRGVEKWLMNDWLEPTKKERAIPGLEGKFNSGDNPVLAAAAGIILLGVLNGLVEAGLSINDEV